MLHSAKVPLQVTLQEVKLTEVNFSLKKATVMHKGKPFPLNPLEDANETSQLKKEDLRNEKL